MQVTVSIANHRDVGVTQCSLQSLNKSDIEIETEVDARGSAVLASIINSCKDNNVSVPEPSVAAPSSVYLSCSEIGYQDPEN